MDSSAPESKVQVRLSTRHADIELPEDPGPLLVSTGEFSAVSRDCDRTIDAPGDVVDVADNRYRLESIQLV